MTTPASLLMFSFAAIVGINSLLKGGTIATLPFGYSMADGSDNYLEIWFFSCLVFGYLLIVNYRVYNGSRLRKKSA